MQDMPVEIVRVIYGIERYLLNREAIEWEARDYHVGRILAATKIQLMWQKKLSRYWERQAKMERNNRGIERQWFHSLIEGNKQVNENKDLRIRIYLDKIAELEKTIDDKNAS